MKLLAVLMTLVIPIFAQAECTGAVISGTVIVSETGYTLVDPTEFFTSNLVPSTDTAKKALAELQTGDHVSGTGCLLVDTFVIERVEFVGLKRLFGLWQAPSLNIRFRDFNRVNFAAGYGRGNRFRYTLSPHVGNTWRIFISDDTSVTMGIITIQQDTANLDLYDPETGVLEQSLSLTKVL